tara:strand:- start:568 stop:1314 length:747 start_codon:yes stop_codon:yes gene_type:complete
MLLLLLTLRYFYNKPLIELFDNMWYADNTNINQWNLCDQEKLNYLKTKMLPSTINNLEYSNIRLACKKCPPGMTEDNISSESILAVDKGPEGCLPIGDDRCDTDDCRCNKGEGDCDADEDCKDGLVCRLGSNDNITGLVIPSSYPSTYSYCWTPTSTPTSTPINTNTNELNNPNQSCYRDVIIFKEGEPYNGLIDTMDANCGYSCYKERCEDYNLQPIPLTGLDENSNTDFVHKRLICVNKPSDKIGK